MLRHLRTVPNQLTCLRLLLVPVIWVFALMHYPVFVGVGMIIAGLTDAIDGFLARKLNQVSEFGAKFDALADNILIPSAVIWLLILRPSVFTDHPVIFVAAFSLYGLSILVGLAKHKRLANLHLYSSKAAGIVEYAFIVHALLFGAYHPMLFYAAFGMFMLSSAETLILQLTQSEVDENMGSIVLIWTGNRASQLPLSNAVRD